MIVSDATAFIVLLNLEKLPLYDKTTAHRSVELPSNFEVVECKDELYFDLLALLDPGESESIAFAKKMGLPLLIDEKKGRRVAKDLGITYFGLIRIALLADSKRDFGKRGSARFAGCSCGKRLSNFSKIAPRFY